MSVPSILVTGATGCVGRAVVRAAVGLRWKVHGLARHVSTKGWPPGATLFAGDVRDRAAVEEAAAGCNAIVHLAGWVHRIPRTQEDVRELESSIVGGTSVVADVAARSVARLVYASSIAVFGRGASADEPLRPSTPYGRAKLAAERVATSACPQALILRPALVYGPHDRGNVARLIRLIDRRLGFVVGDGTNRKSIVHADNLADRIVAGVQRADLYGAWIAADDPAPMQIEIVDEIARALHRRRPVKIPLLPLSLAAATVDRIARTHWRDRVASFARSTAFQGFALDRALGYSPRVRWPEGLHTQVERWISA